MAIRTKMQHEVTRIDGDVGQSIVIEITIPTNAEMIPKRTDVIKIHNIRRKRISPIRGGTTSEPKTNRTPATFIVTPTVTPMLR
jgi:hypothetical protein